MSGRLGECGPAIGRGCLCTGQDISPHFSPFGEGTSIYVTYVPDVNGAEPTRDEIAAKGDEENEVETEDETMPDGDEAVKWISLLPGPSLLLPLPHPVIQRCIVLPRLRRNGWKLKTQRSKPI
jgi:hypothetical protein